MSGLKLLFSRFRYAIIIKNRYRGIFRSEKTEKKGKNGYNPGKNSARFQI